MWLKPLFTRFYHVMKIFFLQENYVVYIGVGILTYFPFAKDNEIIFLLVYKIK